MKYTPSQKLTETTLARFFEDVWNAEVSSDVEALHSLFQNIWENIDEDPNFEEYTDLERAQLFRYYGYFLSHYGQARNLPSYQERGKNLLTRAIELFSFLNLPEKATEAEIILGLCYFHEGAIAESESIFEHISNQFENNQLHPLYLRTQLNSTLILQWKGDYQKALKIIEDIEIPMEFCNDARLLTIYYTQAGLIYRGINQYDLAVYNYNKCIEVAQAENNWLVVSKNHNNLAFLYKNLNQYELAHYHVERAIEISQEFKYNGWLPHFLDTKAIIYLEDNKFEAALATINEAVSIFRQGDDYAGLVDALWNKVRNLLSLDRKEEAVEIFAELCRIAQLRIGDYAVRRYSRLFAGIIYVKQSTSLENEVARFKKSEITAALERSKYNVGKAAKLLGFAGSDDLSKLISKEFPTLYQELGISDLLAKPEIKKINKANSIESEPSRQINKIELQDVEISFIGQAESFSIREIQTFYLSSEIASAVLEITEDVVLAVVRSHPPQAGELVMARRRDNQEYIFSRVSHDKSLDIFYLLNRDEPFPLEEVTIIGQAVGYCLFADVDRENLIFTPLPVAW